MIFKSSNPYHDLMLAYINKKYPDDKFEYRGPTGGGASASTKTIIVSSELYPEADVYVRYSTDGEIDTYSDNYMSVVYAKQVESGLETLVESLSDHISLFYSPSRYACPNDTGPIDFQTYARNKESSIGFTAVVYSQDIDKAIIEETLKTAVSDSGICCFGTVYFESSLDAILQLSETSLSAYLFKHTYFAALSFEADEAPQVITMEWEQ